LTPEGLITATSSLAGILGSIGHTIVYIPGESNTVADACHHLPNSYFAIANCHYTIDPNRLCPGQFYQVGL